MATIEVSNPIEGAAGPYLVSGAPVAGTTEVQTLTIGGTPTGGTFKLKFDGHETAAITWTATDATLVTSIDTALSALSNIPSDGVVVADSTLTSGIGDATITFAGDLAKKAQPLITVSSNALTGTDPTVEVAETTPGVNASGIGAAPGALLVDTDTPALYLNSGTAALPVWDEVGGA